MDKNPAARRPTPPQPNSMRGAPGTTFRKAIEAAVAEGVAPEDMTLWLTLGDVSQLKRDPNLALSDISYAGGVMRFLKVQVSQGGVTESRLERG